MRRAQLRGRSSQDSPSGGYTERGHPALRARLASSRLRSLALHAGWDLCSAEATIYRLRARSASLALRRADRRRGIAPNARKWGGGSGLCPHPGPGGRRTPLRGAVRTLPRESRGGPPVLSRAADNASVIETKRSGRAEHIRSNDQARNCTIFPRRGVCRPPRAVGPTGRGQTGSRRTEHRAVREPELRPPGRPAPTAAAGCAVPLPLLPALILPPVSRGSTGGYVLGSQR